jgi:hypothetical protein
VKKIGRQNIHHREILVRDSRVIGNGMFEYHQVAVARLVFALVREEVRDGAVRARRRLGDIGVVRARDDDRERCPRNSLVAEVQFWADSALRWARKEVVVKDIWIAERDCLGREHNQAHLPTSLVPRIHQRHALSENVLLLAVLERRDGNRE